MQFDSETNVRALERTVAYVERDGKPASAVTLSRSYETTLENLWDAVTSLERIPRWFAGITGDLEVGGRFQLQDNASGTILAAERLESYSVTWEFAGDVSWVDVQVADEGADRARFTLTHTALLSPHWDTFGAGAAGVGWEMGFAGLALHLAQPDAPRPDEMDFVTSAEGKAFIAGSSEGWAQASTAAGTDPDAAHAAARQTTAFYTGESLESS